MPFTPTTLATDLDGTLIPIDREHAQQEALRVISRAYRRDFEHLVFATGRPWPSVRGAIAEFGLPQPDWIVCDVGASVYHRSGGSHRPFEPYARQLQSITGRATRDAVEAALADLAALELQAAVNQTRFKISYKAPAAELEALVEAIESRLGSRALPFRCIGSIDPFEGCALLDVLPAGVSKASALSWLATHADFDPDAVLYAGDSGNDYAALVSGFRAIVVANATAGLLERVRARLDANGQRDRLYAATGKATAGVLEGCRHFGLL